MLNVPSCGLAPVDVRQAGQALQESLAIVARTDPLKVLPPRLGDRVTMPPVNRPYSAETLERLRFVSRRLAWAAESSIVRVTDWKPEMLTVTVYSPCGRSGIV